MKGRRQKGKHILIKRGGELNARSRRALVHHGGAARGPAQFPSPDISALIKSSSINSSALSFSIMFDFSFPSSASHAPSGLHNTTGTNVDPYP